MEKLGLAAFDMVGPFDMFTQSIKFYIVQATVLLYILLHVLRAQLFEDCDSQIDSKNKWLLLPARFTAKFVLVFVLTLETIFLRGFILKPSETAQLLLKNDNRDFQNSPPFEKSACFYVTICENFKRFQQFNVETDFLENENLCQKTGVPSFSWKH